MEAKTFKNGAKMPVLGLGTWKSGPGEVYQAVREAIRVGYRHIDCAPVYENEKEVGNALHDAFADDDVIRGDMWITSKLWNSAHGHDQVLPALEQTMQDLQLDYLDLYLIHWPVVFKAGVGLPESIDDFVALEDAPISETWKGMEDCKRQGKARNIGVSNFSSVKISNLLQACNTPPEMNQVEMHPLLCQQTLVDFCFSHDIHLTAYSPLGSIDRPEMMKGANEPRLLKNAVIEQIALELQVSAAQILIAWAIQRGSVVIPKSTNQDRIKQNFDAALLKLSSGQMEKINALDRHFRYVDGSFFTPEGSPYSLKGLWDE